MKNKEQFIVAHPVNPPYHAPMVELVPASVCFHSFKSKIIITQSSHTWILSQISNMDLQFWAVWPVRVASENFFNFAIYHW